MSHLSHVLAFVAMRNAHLDAGAHDAAAGANCGDRRRRPEMLDQCGVDASGQQAAGRHKTGPIGIKLRR